MEILEKVEKLKAELDSLRPFDPEREARIWQKLRLDWNYHSNKLEGNTYSYGETKMLLMKGLTAGGKPIRDHEEITGHDQAITFVLESIREKEVLTETLIRHLHSLALVRDFWSEAKTSDGHPTKRLIKIGVYKSDPNHVETQSGEIFRFAEPIETPVMMGDLIAWYRAEEDRDDVSPVLLATEFHYRFVRIHPFGDGNGRVARLLMNFILMKFGYPPIIIRSEDKDNYIAALEQAEYEILEPSIEYIANNLYLSLDLMVRGAQGESIDDPSDIDKEISLLKRRIKGYGKTITRPKDLTVVRERIEDSIFPLYEKLVLAFKTFDDFYVESHARIFLNGQAVSGEYDNAPTSVRKLLEKSPENPIGEVKLSYLSSELSQSSFGRFIFEASLAIAFEPTRYSIRSGNGRTNLEKLYNEILEDDEIDRIVQDEKKVHLEILKRKMEEMDAMVNPKDD